MIINGKERKFRYNVWASGKIAKLTATGEIKDIMNEIQNDARAADLIPQIAIIMNTAFEKHKQMKATARGEDYATDILDISEINDLTVKESTDLMKEIFSNHEGRRYGRNRNGTRKNRKKNRTGRKNNGITLNTAWFLFFGRKLGMQKTEILDLKYGEMMDMINCMTIYNGGAKQKAKRRRLSYDDAINLR